MKSAGDGTPAMEVEERFMEHMEMIYNLSAAMDRVVQNMDRWEFFQRLHQHNQGLP
jgi:hypothetical protein